MSPERTPYVVDALLHIDLDGAAVSPAGRTHRDECDGTQVALPTAFLTSRGTPATRGGCPMTVQRYRPPAPDPAPMNSTW